MTNSDVTRTTAIAAFVTRLAYLVRMSFLQLERGEIAVSPQFEGTRHDRYSIDGGPVYPSPWRLPHAQRRIVLRRFHRRYHLGWSRLPLRTAVVQE